MTATADSAKLVPDPKEVVETVAPGTTPQFIPSLKAGAEKDKATVRYAFADHSVTCDICTGEVDMMASMPANTPLSAIRDQIGKKYNYTGVWTDTPPIQ